MSESKAIGGDASSTGLYGGTQSHHTHGGHARALIEPIKPFSGFAPRRSAQRLPLLVTAAVNDHPPTKRYEAPCATVLPVVGFYSIQEIDRSVDHAAWASSRSLGCCSYHDEYAT